MKAILGILLSVLAAQAHAQSVEADLDGNASALQASEMRPQPQSTRPQPQARQAKKQNQRIASR